MSEAIFDKNSNTPLYIQLYSFFKRLIESGQLKSGDKLVSIRRCCEQFNVSKTTAQDAYLLLAAEGYIISKPQSGYYVCKLNLISKNEDKVKIRSDSENNYRIDYDLTSSSLDINSFDFSLWSRYVKSALRQNERLISYGQVQGEYDLRKAVCSYINEHRSVYSNPEQIVIGAGTQSLIHILCSILPKGISVAFIGSSFERGKAVFNDYGYKCYDYEKFPEDLEVLNENNIKLIYISPSHFNGEGDILPINQRYDLINFSRKNNCLIIEDDYDSEFRYYSKTVPSLQGIAGGKNIIYLATFSKLLLPSIRISFMVLPQELLENYQNKGQFYNQTASVLEQIALCQFIRDGHLFQQIRKLRKLFSAKSEALSTSVQNVFGDKAKVSILPSGYLVKAQIKHNENAENIALRLKKSGVALKVFSDNNGVLNLILSCTGTQSKDFNDAVSLIYTVIFQS